jgi:hypothetical protein
MFIELDDVRVAVPQPVIDAFVALDQFEKAHSAYKLSDAEYSVQFDALVEQLDAQRKSSFPAFKGAQFEQLNDAVWEQIL